MKIALLTDGIYPYVIGGMQKHSYYLTKYLAKNKIHVDLYHFSNNREYNIDKLEIFTKEEKKYITSYVLTFPKHFHYPGHYICESYEYSKKIFNHLKNNLTSVDFIYAKGFTGWKLIKEKKNGFNCPPIGIKLHGLEMFQQAPSFKVRLGNYLLNPVAKYNMKNANYVFSYGGKITVLTEQIGIPHKNIIEIPSGIEKEYIVDNVSYPDKYKKFLFIGRYERRKGIEELSACLNQLINEYNFEFNFIGNIPEKLKIISPKIIYHGLIANQEKIIKIMDSCDVLVCPSHSEGMPNVILEAMGRGLAIIATDVGAINVMVSDNNGWLLNSPSVSAISGALKEALLLDNKELIKKKENSINLIKEKFIWEKIVGKLISEISAQIH